MKVTKKLLNKCYAFLMALVMVIGLSGAPVITANAEENGVPEECTGEFTWYNDEHFDSIEEAKEQLAGVSAENKAADMADNYLSDSGEVVEIPTFKDTSSAADYVRKCFVERRSSIEFVYDFDYVYHTIAYGELLSEEAWDEIYEKALQETPEADEGDYLHWNLGEWTAEYKGETKTDIVTFTVSPSYFTTAAQEAAVTNKVNSLLETDFDGWESHTDISNTYDVFWWIIDHFDVATTANPIDVTAYAGFATGKTLQPGYAAAAYRLLREMGVSSRIVANYDDENPHVWNIVGINGLYYNFDAYFGDVSNTFFGPATAEGYLLVSDDFLWDVNFDIKYTLADDYGIETDLYSTGNHSKDYDYRNDDFNAKYPMATNDYLSFDPAKEEATVVTAPGVGVTYHTHIQKYGWENPWKSNGQMSGTSGEAKRLEGIEIKVTGAEGLDLGIEYKTHIQSYGWESDWKANGAMSGTSGQAKRLEALKIRLTGSDAAMYDVYYRVHAQSYGWLGWAKNGEEAGTAGQSKRLEGIEIVVLKKGETPKTGILGYSYIEYGKKAELNSEITGLVNYTTHVQSYGWQGYVYDGSLSGTYGESKRLEGINISLGNTGYSGGITYRTHIQSIGWQEWKADGAMSGTSGQAKRLEAIEIKLTGDVAKHYDVYYRVHAQTFGWLGWAKNGEASGTEGFGKRLEAIQIVLLPKGSAAPGSTSLPFVKK